MIYPKCTSLPHFCLLILKQYEFQEEVMESRLLNRKQVEGMTGLSRSTLYRQMRTGTFPTPLKVGARAVRWRPHDIVEWLESRPRATGDFPREKGSPAGDAGA